MNVSRAGREGEDYYAGCARQGVNPNPHINIGDYRHLYGVRCSCGEWTWGEEWTRCPRCLMARYRELQAEGVVA